mmetsp:Transcript_11469/g.33062  ORF Transcript_11469/g.33062 Transcript_11469/m.33062 type:complete len:546 (+) Transcript_11469:3-1640(+)
MSSSGRLSRFVLSPGSPWRLTWDLLNFTIVGYDMVFLPLQAFDLSPHRFMAIMNWVTSIFWSLDMLVSFFTGFENNGLVEMRCSKIARRYLRSWFVFDLLLVAFEWFVLLQETDGGTDMLSLGRSGKVIRLMRMMRMLRFLRLVKMMSVLVEFSDFVHSDGALTVFGVLKLLVASFALNHCVACAWYFVGASRVEEWSWVDQFARGAQVEADDLAYYLSALHWSLTQFTPASMEVVPRNTMERAFNIGVIILALLCTSSFLSSITTQMTHLRRLNEEQNRQHELARKYITDHKVHLALGNRVIGFVRQYIAGKKSRVHEVDVKAFMEMPKSLKLELHAQVYMPTLLPHPLFFHHHASEPKGLAMICHTAMGEKTLWRGHELFSVRQKATSMVFLVMGDAEYKAKGMRSEILSAGDELCEVALWLEWRHRGRFQAMTQMCELFVLDSELFGKAVSSCTMVPCYRSYAKLFADRLTEVADPKRITDIWPQFDILLELAQRAFEGVEAGVVAVPRPSLNRGAAWRSWRTKSRLVRSRFDFWPLRAWRR